jgi:hypothetical protein
MMLENENRESIEYGKIKLRKPKSVIDGYFSKIVCENNEKLTLDTPYLKIMDVVFRKNSSVIKFKINEDTRDLFQSIYDIEEFLLLGVEENSEKWFNKKLTVEVLYKNQIKPWSIDRNGDIIMKMSIRNNREFRKIKADDYLSLTLHLEGIHFNSKTFTSSWKCIEYKSFDDNYNLFQNIEDDNLFSISLNKNIVDTNNIQVNKEEILDEIENNNVEEVLDVVQKDNLKENLLNENIVNEDFNDEKNNGISKLEEDKSERLEVVFPTEEENIEVVVKKRERSIKLHKSKKMKKLKKKKIKKKKNYLRE